MYNFNKKQKIILGVLTALVVGGICYYVYAKEDNNTEQLELENNLEISNNKVEEQEQYSDDKILVHVSGAVNKEGIVELKVNSRISDAIEKAGGIREDANTENINLAYKLEDGMKIHIPTKQEIEDANKTNTSESEKDDLENYVTTSSGITTNQEESPNTKSTKININTATQTQLETLPGIGPSTATKIIAYRKEKGKFTKIEDIKEINGIGDSKYEKIKDYITVK